MKNWFRKVSTTPPAEHLTAGASALQTITQAAPPMEVPDARTDGVAADHKGWPRPAHDSNPSTMPDAPPAGDRDSAGFDIEHHLATLFLPVGEHPADRVAPEASPSEQPEPEAPFDTYLHGNDAQFYLDTRTTRTSKETLVGAIDLNGKHFTTTISEKEGRGIGHHLALPPHETVKLRYGNVLLEFMSGNRPKVAMRFVAENVVDRPLVSVCLVGDELGAANRMFSASYSMNSGRDDRLCTSMIFDIEIDEPMWLGGPQRVVVHDHHVAGR